MDLQLFFCFLCSKWFVLKLKKNVSRILERQYINYIMFPEIAFPMNPLFAVQIHNFSLNLDSNIYWLAAIWIFIKKKVRWKREFESYELSIFFESSLQFIDPYEVQRCYAFTLTFVTSWDEFSLLFFFLKGLEGC